MAAVGEPSYRTVQALVGSASVVSATTKSDQGLRSNGWWCIGIVTTGMPYVLGFSPNSIKGTLENDAVRVCRERFVPSGAGSRWE